MYRSRDQISSDRLDSPSRFGSRLPALLSGIVTLAACSSMLFAIGCGGGDDSGASDDAGDAGDDTAAETTDTPSDAAPPEPAALDADVPPELSASHILIQYQGSLRASPEVTRSKDDAASLAKDVAKKAQGGDDFAALAAEYSDGPTKTRGGMLGTFQARQMIPEFSNACAKLDTDEISDPVETQFGFHIIQRHKIEKVSARHILIQYQGSARAGANITRTQEEAAARCAEVLKEIQGGLDFEQAAIDNSDGPSGPRGGDLGSFGRGAMAPPFEDAAFGLEVDGISGVVETDFGYHIIQRYQ